MTARYFAYDRETGTLLEGLHQTTDGAKLAVKSWKLSRRNPSRVDGHIVNRRGKIYFLKLGRQGYTWKRGTGNG